MTYSVDFRRKVLEIKEKEQLTFAELCKRFGIGINSAVRWSKKLEPEATRNKPATKIDMEALKRDIQTSPDSYQYERAIRLKVSRSCVHFALKRLNVTYKKKSSASQSSSRKAQYVLPRASSLQRPRMAPCLA